jgi:tetratricopeptide (TPR) repeat protein
MKHTFVLIIILVMAGVSAGDKKQAEQVRTIELTLHPAKAPEPVDKYLLLPKAEEQSDANAASLYEKAVKSLPKNLQSDLISKWSRAPLEELPIEQVQSTLQQLEPTVQLLEEAAKCKHCKWPESEVTEDQSMEALRNYRHIIYILALQTRMQIAQDHYDEAIASLQTGFAMAKHLTENPNLVYGFIGISTAAFMCKQLEQFIQGTEAPNLYWALHNLQKPVIDLTEQVVLEPPDIRAKVHLLMNRLDRHVAVLQCIEAMRLYAAKNGEFPNNLSNIADVAIPDDPAIGKPFMYHLTGSKAILEAPAPEGTTAKYAMRYELKLKNE